MGPADGRRTLILNVDDYEASRYARSQVLRRAGFEVLEAGTGREALAAAATARPGLVLLDVNLPDMSGLDVCRALKADPHTMTVAVLHISATFTGSAHTVRGLDGGADGYLIEPVDPPVLLATVNALLRARRAEEALLGALAGERAAREELEAANRAKDDFLATLSHELRAPLGAILGWTRLLRSGTLDPARAAHAMDVIERNTHAQAQLIEDMLDLSRITTGQLRLDVRPVDLVAVVRAALDSIRPAADAKGLLVRLAAGPSEVVLGDAGRLQQVVWNLLSNAAKFTPAGGRVDVRLQAAGDDITLAVADTGEGIAPDFLPYVFRRFHQAESGRARPHRGLGLGLAIVRHIVELHGGTVDVASPGLGRGSTFTVALPRHRALVAPPTPASAPAADDALAGVRVLLVDDDADAREVLAACLTVRGADVTRAADADAALEALRRAPLDIVLSDIGMPGRDGLALVTAIRALPEPDGRRLPVVAVSAYAMPRDEAQALGAGYDLYLRKPVDPETVVRAVLKLLDR